MGQHYDKGDSGRPFFCLNANYLTLFEPCDSL